MKFGAQSEHDPLQSVFMHRPEPDDLRWITDETLSYHNFDAPVDPERFLVEYDAMAAAIANEGVEIVFLTDVLKTDSECLDYISRRPNLTYTRDMAIVFDRGAAVANPRIKGRQWDNWVVARCFERLGVPILVDITYPGYLEGGCFEFLNRRIGIVSLCDRANEDGVGQLAKSVLPECLDELAAINLPNGFVHIDGLLMTIDERTAFLHRPVFEMCPTRIVKVDGSQRFVWLPDYLEDLGFELIDGGGGLDMNFVAVRPRELIGYETSTANIGEIGARGGRVIGVPDSELRKGRAGVHCMTCPILREP
jgi:arginine deiminase